AYVVGYTASTDVKFPKTNAVQSQYGGGTYDAYLCELNPNGSGVVFSTYIGGSGTEAAYGVALDSNTNIYVTGYTESANLPMTNALQSAYGGNGDAFVRKFSPSGQLVFST